MARIIDLSEDYEFVMNSKVVPCFPEASYSSRFRAQEPFIVNVGTRRSYEELLNRAENNSRREE